MLHHMQKQAPEADDAGGTADVDTSLPADLRHSTMWLQRPSGMVASSRTHVEQQRWPGHRPESKGALLQGTSRSASGGSIRYPADSPLAAAMRRQIEDLNKKLSFQIGCLQEQVRSTKIKEAIFSRLEERMSATEATSSRLERRLAELTGKERGLSDEMQSQIRRMDMMDDRLCSWRNQFEEEVRQRHSNLEQKFQKLSSGFRVTESSVQEGQKQLNKRLQRFEMEVKERLAIHGEIPDGAYSVNGRLDALERHCSEERTAGAHNTNVSMIGQRLAEVSSSVDRVVQDTHDLYVRIAEQEQQQKALRTLVDMREQHSRSTKEHMEDWDGRLEHLHHSFQEEAKQRTDHFEEKLEFLERRLGFQEAHEDMHIMQRPMTLATGELHERDGPQASPLTPHTIRDVLKECQERVKQSEASLQRHEARFAVLDVELEANRGDRQFTPRVVELVNQLKEVAPRVIEQEWKLRQLEEMAAPQASVVAGVQDGLRQLEAGARQMQREVEHLTRLSSSARDLADQTACTLGAKTKQFDEATELIRQFHDGAPKRAEAVAAQEAEARRGDNSPAAAGPQEFLERMQAFERSAQVMTQEIGAHKFDAATVVRSFAADVKEELAAQKLNTDAAVTVVSDIREEFAQVMRQIHADRSALGQRAADMGSLQRYVDTCTGDVACLRQEVAKLATTNVSGSPLNGATNADDERILELVQHVRNNQENESRSHSSVRGCIDELVSHLRELDHSVRSNSEVGSHRQLWSSRSEHAATSWAQANTGPITGEGLE